MFTCNTVCVKRNAHLIPTGKGGQKFTWSIMLGQTSPSRVVTQQSAFLWCLLLGWKYRQMAVSDMTWPSACISIPTTDREVTPISQGLRLLGYNSRKASVKPPTIGWKVTPTTISPPPKKNPTFCWIPTHFYNFRKERAPIVDLIGYF